MKKKEKRNEKEDATIIPTQVPLTLGGLLTLLAVLVIVAGVMEAEEVINIFHKTTPINLFNIQI